MNNPLHLYDSAPVKLPASQLHDRLVVAPQALVTAATGDALETTAAFVRSWGWT